MPSYATILVVEDDPRLCSIVRRFLLTDGYAVLTAGSGEAALDLLDGLLGDADLVVTDATLGRPPVPANGVTVVSDLRLGGMHGCALGAEIARRWPAIRLLFISGYDAPELSAAHPCPPDLPLLMKPFTMEALLARVRATLEAPPWVPGEKP